MGKNNSEIREDKNQMYNEIKNVYDKISAAFGIQDIKTVLSYFSDSSEMVKVSNGIIIRGKKIIIRLLSQKNWSARRTFNKN